METGKHRSRGAPPPPTKKLNGRDYNKMNRGD